MSVAGSKPDNKWKDATSYSKTNRDAGPTVWALKLGPLRLLITCGHIYYPGKWVMHCRPFYDTHELKVKTKEQAQEKSLRLIRQQIQLVSKAIDEAPDEQ